MKKIWRSARLTGQPLLSYVKGFVEKGAHLIEVDPWDRTLSPHNLCKSVDLNLAPHGERETHLLLHQRPLVRPRLDGRASLDTEGIEKRRRGRSGRAVQRRRC